MTELPVTAAFGISEDWDLMTFEAAAELFEGSLWQVLLTSGAAPLGAVSHEPENDVESKIIICVQPESISDFMRAPIVAGSLGLVMIPDLRELKPNLDRWALRHTAPWNALQVETQPGGTGKLVVFETFAGPAHDDGARVAFRAWGVVPLPDEGMAAFIDFVTYDARYIEAVKQLCRQVVAGTRQERSESHAG